MFMMGKRKMRSGKELLIPDPLLMSRLNNYLEARKNEVAIDQNKLVEDLRNTYKDYSKKDKTSFRASVFRAYNYIVEPLVNPSAVLEPDDVSSAESCDDDDDDEIIDTDDLCDDVEVEVLDASKTRDKGKNNGNVSYLQTVQNMTNPVNRTENKSTNSDKETSSVREMTPQSPLMDAIDISSDEEDQRITPVPNLVHCTSTPAKITSNQLSIKKFQVSNKSAVMSRLPPLTINPVISLLPGAVSTPTAYMSSSPLKRKGATPTINSVKRMRGTTSSMILPKFRLKDFGGYKKINKALNCLFQHLKYPEVYGKLGISPPTGFLLHGPPGSGKSLLAQCIAGELSMPLLKVVGPELVSGISGDSEQRIRSLFDSAVSSAPCVLFIDEIDAITQPRDSASKDMERRIVAQLLASFDELHDKLTEDLVIVIGATNRADSLDPALRRAGRFDREIVVGMPDKQTRADILQLLTDTLRLHPQLSLESVAAATPGYVGADLKALTTQAAYHAVNRYMEMKDRDISPCQNVQPAKEIENEEKSSEKQSKPEASTDKEETVMEKSKDTDKVSPEIQLEEQNQQKSLSTVTLNDTIESIEVCADDSDTLDALYIESQDFMKALKFVQPSAKREGFATVPDITWSDIGSLDHIREQLNLSIMMPVKYPEEFERLGVTSPSGILLCGPPGCGKTLLAKAVANEANINFISVKGPELLNMYVGESEKAVRQVFQRARNSQPCVIFFDEIDALCPKRSDSSEGGGRAGSRVVNQLLTEMDGVEGGRGGVYMMAATNRPDMVDPAVLRPGRFDKVLYVGLPSPADRSLILKAITKNGTKPELTSEVDLDSVGLSEKCNGFSGADLSAVIKEASIQALSEYIKNNRTSDLKVSNKHINAALTKIRPSVSEEERVRYEIYRIMYTPRDPSEEKMEEDD